MTELGFSYDPSTAGSSVRFDHPKYSDRVSTFVFLQSPSLLTLDVKSISFHKRKFLFTVCLVVAHQMVDSTSRPDLESESPEGFPFKAVEVLLVVSRAIEGNRRAWRPQF